MQTAGNRLTKLSRKLQRKKGRTEENLFLVCGRKSIEEALLSLKNWNPAKNEYNSYDSYYVLNFKVRSNEIVDIF